MENIFTLQRASSQNPDKYSDKQARVNSADPRQIQFPKEPFDLGPYGKFGENQTK